MPIVQDPSERIDFLHKKVKTLLRQKKNILEIFDALKKEGVEPDYAKTIIENVLKDDNNKKNFYRLLVAGLLFIIAGTVLSFLSHKLSVISHSFVFFGEGVIVVGIILLINAYILFKK